MGARAEGAAGIDHDRQKSFCGFFPGRADPELPDLDRAMEGAPVVLPTRFHQLGRNVGEARAQGFLGLLPAVYGQLELSGEIPFLEAVRGELEQLRARLLRLLERDANGDASQLGQ